MADNYKGITIEFNGDTSKLGKALSNVEKQSRETNKSLREIEQSLKFNPGNVDLLAQQQRKLKDAIIDTKEKLSLLKEADKQAKKQLADGKMSQEAYDSLQREILKTENQLERFENKLVSSSKASDSLNQALNKIAKESGKTKKELDDIEKSLKFNPGNAELVAQQQGKLAEAIQQTGKKLDILREKDKQAKEQLSRGDIGREEYNKLQREIVDTEKEYSNLNNRLKESQNEQDKLKRVTATLQQELRKSGKSIDDLADTMGQDFVDAFKRGEGSSNDIEKALSQLEKQTQVSAIEAKELGDSFVSLEAVAGVFERIRAAAAKAFNAISDAWMEIDDSLDTIIKKTGASGDAFNDMNQQFEDIYSTMPVSADAVGNAIGEVNTQFGVQGDELEKLSKSFLQYAEINDTDVTGATQQARKAMDQFGLSSKDVGPMLDVVSKAGQDTGVSVDKLFDVVTKGAPVLQDMGLSFEESVVLMSQFEQSGVDSSKALGYLTKAQAQAAKDGKNITEVLAEFGKTAGESEDDVKAVAAAAELFGSKGGSMMLKATKDGKLNFEALSAAAADASGVVESTYLATLDPADKFTEAQNNLNLAMSDVGSVVQETLAPTIEKLADLIREASSWFRNLDDDTKNTIVTIGGVIAAIVSAVSVVAMLKSAFAVAAPIINGFKDVFIGIKGAMLGLASPVLSVIAVVGVLVAAFVSLWKTNEDFRNQIIAIWENIKSTFDGLTSGIVERLNALGFNFEDFGDVVRTIWQGFTEILGPVFIGAFENISIAFEFFTNIILGLWDTFSALFRGDWEGVWDGIKSIFTGIWDGIKGYWSNVFETLRNVADIFLGWFGTSVDEVWGFIKNVFEVGKLAIISVFEAIKTVVLLPFQLIWQNFGDKITSIWTATTDKVTAIANALRDTFSRVFNAIKGIVEPIWNGVKDVTVNVWDRIKSTISTVVNFMKDLIEKQFNAIKKVADTVFGAVEKLIGEPIKRARNVVREQIQKIKDLFKFEWSFPKLKLPHFSIKGKFSLTPPSVPRLDVAWYDKGGIFTGPQIIGVGEKRPEFVGALDDLKDIVKEAMEERSGGLGAPVIHIEKMEVRNDQDIERFAELLYQKISRESRRLSHA